MLVAKTKERESYSDDGVFWWREFRVRPISADEFYALNLGISVHREPFVLEQRYLCRLPNGVVCAKIDQGGKEAALANPESVKPAEWKHWDFAKTKRLAISHMLGDSDFSKAESLCEEFSQLVILNRDMQEKAKALHEAKSNLNSDLTQLEEFKREQTRLFDKRHGHRSEEEREKFRLKTKKRLAVQYERYVKAVKDAELVLKQAEEDLELAKRLLKEYELGGSDDEGAE